MKLALFLAALATGATAKGLACEKNTEKVSMLVQAKVATLGNVCEDMCRKMGAYPNCQCPGFGSQPGELEAGRSCYDTHCQDPKNPCMGGGASGDYFVSCVKTKTAVGGSLLSWDSTVNLIQANMDAMLTQMRNVRLST